MRIVIEEFSPGSASKQSSLRDFEEALTIGRGAIADVKIGGEMPAIVANGISRIQCTLIKKGYTFLIDGSNEKASKTGVTKDGIALDGQAVVNVGDVFKIFSFGEYLVTLTAKEDSSPIDAKELLQRLRDETGSGVQAIGDDVRAKFDAINEDVDSLRLGIAANHDEINKAQDSIKGISADVETGKQSNSRQNQFIFGLLVFACMMALIQVADPTKRDGYLDRGIDLLLKLGGAVVVGYGGSQLIKPKTP